MDAITAQAYGLKRKHYECILASFSHKSFPEAPNYCLSAFDELTAKGREAVSRRHDPYWKILLVTTPAKLAITLPVSAKRRDLLSAIPNAGLAAFPTNADLPSRSVIADPAPAA